MYTHGLFRCKTSNGVLLWIVLNQWDICVCVVTLRNNENLKLGSLKLFMGIYMNGISHVYSSEIRGLLD